jgi:hypothetical protein
MKSKVRTNLRTRDTQLPLIPLSNIGIMETIE